MESATGHVVLDTGTDDGFTSLRRPARPRADRYELGRSLRERAHRSDMAFWPTISRPMAALPGRSTTVATSS